MTNTWIYRVGLGQNEVSQEALVKSGLKYELIEVESAIRAHVDETLGKPYKLNTSMREDAPNYFSCSSLISYLYIFAGIWMPSLSWEKYEYVRKIEKEDLRFGDLVFSHHGRLQDKPVDHLGMYLGDGKILDASGKWYKEKVLVDDLSTSPSYSNIIGFGRVVDDLSEKRFVVEIPEDRIDLRNKEALIKEINK